MDLHETGNELRSIEFPDFTCHESPDSEEAGVLSIFTATLMGIVEWLHSRPRSDEASGLIGPCRGASLGHGFIGRARRPTIQPSVRSSSASQRATATFYRARSNTADVNTSFDVDLEGSQGKNALCETNFDWLERQGLQSRPSSG